jgi:carboxypeptidase C (cathepsin A)
MVNPDGKTLYTNDNSWNKVANVLFLEAPAGVGFSYSDNTADYSKWNDDKTADDTYHFLLNFMAKYPQFANHPFYISGESYAGHYIPTLAYRIDQGNAKSSAKINLQGMLIGNGCTDDVEDANSIPPFLKDHAIIPISYYNIGYNACQGDFYAHQQDPACGDFLNSLFDYLSGWNPYYLYDTCPVTQINTEPRINVDDFVHPLFTMYRRRVSALVSPNAAKDSPCVPDSALENYMNQDAVRTALHATAKQSLRWAVCSGTVNRYYDWQYKSMLPFYRKLLPKYKILAYSGDVDAVVNGLGTQASIDKLGLAVQQEWTRWMVDSDQGRVVGGYMRKYASNLTFITIRGAGHMVPSVKPQAALVFLSKFLQGTL